MAKQAKISPSPSRTTTAVARNLYGRVYMHYGMGDPVDPLVLVNPELAPRHAHCYMARIWNQKGQDIWHGKAFSAEDAFALMREAALKMGEPVDLYRSDSGDRIAETIPGGDLPF